MLSGDGLETGVQSFDQQNENVPFSQHVSSAMVASKMRGEHVHIVDG